MEFSNIFQIVFLVSIICFYILVLKYYYLELKIKNYCHKKYPEMFKKYFFYDEQKEKFDKWSWFLIGGFWLYYLRQKIAEAKDDRVKLNLDDEYLLKDKYILDLRIKLKKLNIPIYILLVIIIISLFLSTPLVTN